MNRAAVLRSRRFAVEERPVPVPGPGQVLLKTRLCGICGSDLHLFKHAEEIAKTAEGFGAPPQDFSQGLVLGHEYVAEVAGYGPETSGALPVGTRVVSVPFLLEGGVPKPIGSNVEVAGAYADYFLGSEALLLPVPDGVPDAAAALVEPLAVAVHAVNKAVLSADTAVILGCGPIGLAIAAVLKMRGLARIIAADFSPRRRELAVAMGATELVDARATSALAPLMAGGPVLVFDCTGAKGVLARAVNEAPIGSEIVVAGIAAGEETVSPMVAIAKELRLSFVVYYAPQEFADALQLIADGKLDWQPLVTGRVGLDGVQQAFADLENPELHAKVLIDPSLIRA